MRSSRPSPVPLTLLAGSALCAFAYAKYKPNPRFFDGKVVILTGGLRGLGLEIARRLHAEGALLALVARGRGGVGGGQGGVG